MNLRDVFFRSFAAKIGFMLTLGIGIVSTISHESYNFSFREISRGDAFGHYRFNIRRNFDGRIAASIAGS
jgi:hypothetical protein